jgi:glycosyltransferase involved in cell wall biosynthesis
MKVLHISTSDKGGASVAALRLHKGLLALNIDSSYLCEEVSLNKPNLFGFKQSYYRSGMSKFIEYYSNRLFWRKQSSMLVGRMNGNDMYSFPYGYHAVHLHPLVQEADIINLHWVSNFVDIAVFLKNINKPVVWTLHDMNPFTAGCHYNIDCNKYEADCNNCPQLKGTTVQGKSKDFFNYKYEAIKSFKNSITIVAPSLWLQQCAKNSQMFRHLQSKHIPYGLDSKILNKHDKKFAREVLGLPQDKKIILFVSEAVSSLRKGMSYLLEALKYFDKNEVIACAIGKENTDLNGIPNIVQMGTLYDEYTMSIAYSSADLIVVPSLQDNLPNVMIEALICGCPVIGFPVGGMLDVIQTNVNGILTKDISPEALLESIKLFLSNIDNYDRDAIRNKAIEKFSMEVQAKSYIDLYKTLIK